MNLLRAAATISGLTLLSRVTGLMREMIVARVFGAGVEVDAFAVAFRLPNLLRRMFAEGAFSQAFVPILAETRSQGGEEQTKLLLSRVASALFWVLLLVSLLGVIAAPALVWLIAGGLREAGFDLATQMTRWMFPYILCMSLVAFSAGVLNTYGRFAVPAFTPVLLNLSFIVFGLWFIRYFNPPILAMAAAVTVGGVLQLLIQIPALARIGMLPRFTGVLTAFRHPGVRRILKLMVPAMFAVSVAQISIIINTAIASRLPTGSISWLYFADRLMEFPTAMLGVAIGTVLLPSLSKAKAEARDEDYSKLLDWGLRLTFLVALPACVGLGMLADGVIAVLYQGAKFDAADVQQTSLALIGYAVGLLGLIAVKILAPGFYARQDIKTPVKIGVAVLIATQLANIALVPWLQHTGLALSVSLGACANALMLFIGLKRRGIYQPQPGWKGFVLRVWIALLLMGAVLGVASLYIDWIGMHEAWIKRAALLAAVIAVAAATYFAALFALGFRPRDFVLRAK